MINQNLLPKLPHRTRTLHAPKHIHRPGIISMIHRCISNKIKEKGIEICGRGEEAKEKIEDGNCQNKIHLRWAPHGLCPSCSRVNIITFLELQFPSIWLSQLTEAIAINPNLMNSTMIFNMMRMSSMEGLKLREIMSVQNKRKKNKPLNLRDKYKNHCQEIKLMMPMQLPNLVILLLLFIHSCLLKLNIRPIGKNK